MTLSSPSKTATAASELLDLLGKRLGRYGLTLHETKTRYVDFRRRRPYGRHWMATATTFDFLGFTHVCGAVDAR